MTQETSGVWHDVSSQDRTIPLLANLFLHYAFDAWMEREFPIIRFERYADDVVIYCKSLKQAEML